MLETLTMLERLGRWRSRIAWDRDEALRGLACAAPGAFAAAFVDVGAGAALALGTLPVAMLGVPVAQAARPRLIVAGLGFAAAYAAGTFLVAWPVVAVLAVVAFALGAVLVAGRAPMARLAPALFAPALALGMNHAAPDGLVLAGLFVLGAAWATLVTWAWPGGGTAHAARPAGRPTASPRASAASGPSRAVLLYAVGFAAAAGIGLALGFLFGLVHVAWAAAAAMLIMRPDPAASQSRALERVVATFVGISVAALIAAVDPTSLALAAIVLAAMGFILGTRGSDLYLTSAGTGLVVLLMSALAGPDALAASYWERLVETALGATLALAFGVALPTWAARRLASSSETA